MIMDFVVAIVDRAKAESMVELYRSHDLPLVLTMLCNGTATSEHLSLYGLEATEKALVALRSLRRPDKATHKERQTQAVHRHTRQRHYAGRPGEERGRRTNLGFSDWQQRAGWRCPRTQI